MPREGVFGAQVQPQQGSNKWAIGIGGAVLGIMALLAILYGSGMFRHESEPAAPVLVQKTTPPAAATQRISTKTTMPKDIEDWLKHLERIEGRKNELQGRQVGAMMGFLTLLKVTGPGVSEVTPGANPEQEPGDVTLKELERLKPQWEALIQDYQNAPPPAECKQVADTYYRALSEIAGMIGDINETLGKVQQDPTNALQAMHAMSNKSVDAIDKPTAEADRGVQAICDKYETPKWFHLGDPMNSLFSKLP